MTSVDVDIEEASSSFKLEQYWPSKAICLALFLIKACSVFNVIDNTIELTCRSGEDDCTLKWKQFHRCTRLLFCVLSLWETNYNSSLLFFTSSKVLYILWGGYIVYWIYIWEAIRNPSNVIYNRTNMTSIKKHQVDNDGKRDLNIKQSCSAFILYL